MSLLRKRLPEAERVTDETPRPLVPDSQRTVLLSLTSRRLPEVRKQSDPLDSMAVGERWCPPYGDAVVGDGGVEGAGGISSDEAKREGGVGGVPFFAKVGGGEVGTEGDICGREGRGKEEQDGEG